LLFIPALLPDRTRRLFEQVPIDSLALVGDVSALQASSSAEIEGFFLRKLSNLLQVACYIALQGSHGNHD
jgi:hypothetical protein